MQTRSQTKYEQSAIYHVEIDFDEASTAWKENKAPTGNGMYRYVCCNNKCKITSMPGYNYCKKHLRQKMKEEDKQAAGGFS